MKNLKLGIKMGLGFAIVLCIMCVLGIMAIRELKSQQEGAASISQAYMPELVLSVRFERATQLTVQSMLRFVSSGEEDSYKEALIHMKEIAQVAKDAEQLTIEHPYLTRLKENVKEAGELYTSYQGLADKTHDLVMSLNDRREHLQATADEFFATLTKTLTFAQEQAEKDLIAGVDAEETLKRVRNIRLTNTALELGNIVQAANNRAQVLSDPAIGEKALPLFEPMLKALAALKENALPQNAERVVKIVALAQNYRDDFSAMLADWKKLRDLTEDRNVVVDKLLANAQKTSTAGISQVQRVCNQAEKLAGASMNLLTGGLIAGILLGLAISLLLTRLITKPLHKSVNFAVSVAEGNLDNTLDIKQRDEVGQLAVALNSMVGTLSHRIKDASEATVRAEMKGKEATAAMQEADAARKEAENAKREGMFAAATRLETVVSSVSSASEQLAAQVEQASRGAQEQADRVNETANAMVEMNSSVLEVARNAGTTADASNQARQKATAGADIVLQVVADMNKINEGAVELKKDMEELSQKAESIGGILNVISDIADQTNLLALNAAIEAARAGEAGRGFAVVADEVRKLAEKTMQATSEVGLAIKGIQDGTNQNMAKVEETVRMVNGVTDLATHSGQALKEIVNLVDRASDQIRTIATASEQQSVTSEKINRSVEQVNRIASETAITMQESGRAVGDLSNQAQVLQDLISQMKRG